MAMARRFTSFVACGLLLVGCIPLPEVFSTFPIVVKRITWTYDQDGQSLSLRVYPDWSRFLLRQTDRPTRVEMIGSVAGRTISYQIKATYSGGGWAIAQLIQDLPRPIYPEAFLLEGPVSAGTYQVVEIADWAPISERERVIGSVDTAIGTGELVLQ